MKIFGVTGWKNAGKTGLMERLIAEFTARGVRVSTVKHAHHTTDVDQPGRDSHRHRVAGAREVILASDLRWALMAELRGEAAPGLDALVDKFAPVDLVLVEGFKSLPHPKIECIRAENNHPQIAHADASVVALASDGPVSGATPPVFDLNDTGAIADFIAELSGLTKTPETFTPDRPKPLKNDCFALPEGVTWTPVDVALAHLKDTLGVVCETEHLSLSEAEGRYLAQDAMARRASPPADNAAVDGYGFAGAALMGATDELQLSLVEGRAAAGAPWYAPVPAGSAIRILTGALTPPGVDTVVMEEDVVAHVDASTGSGSGGGTGGGAGADPRGHAGQIRFSTGQKSGQKSGLKPGANVRRKGEDVAKGAPALAAGALLEAPALGLLASLGVTEVQVFRPLTIGVLSTGDELVDQASSDDAARTYDANRPMLLSLIRRWGFDARDLGQAPDDRATLRKLLDYAASEVDVILTSGGASQGDEDHMSALLAESDALQMWRIAMKPGRPLALGIWNGVPVFGLPGNPVAAFVTALIFARPACVQMAGGDWVDPQGFLLPAAFQKSKKPGRREFQRARITPDGRVELFAHEGSGRLSGLTWADGLVDLPDEAADIAPGDPVRFVPWGSYGM